MSPSLAPFRTPSLDKATSFDASFDGNEARTTEGLLVACKTGISLSSPIEGGDAATLRRVPWHIDDLLATVKERSLARTGIT